MQNDSGVFTNGMIYPTVSGPRWANIEVLEKLIACGVKYDGGEFVKPLVGDGTIKMKDGKYTLTCTNRQVRKVAVVLWETCPAAGKLEFITAQVAEKYEEVAEAIAVLKEYGPALMEAVRNKTKKPAAAPKKQKG